MIISSGKAGIAFKNSTQQFYDSTGAVRVQIGQDGTGKFNFVVKNGDKTALFDENGITQTGIPDNTIVNNMISDGTINKEKLSFTMVEPNEQGGIDISQVYLDGKKFGHRSKGWEWENNWLVWSVVALVVAPWVVAVATVPGLLGVYAAETGPLAVVAFFGLIWGVGAILFGRGIDLLGVGLSMPIMLGLTNVIGTLMPVVLRDPGGLLTASGLRLTAGVLVIVLGIVFYSVAGSLKERGAQTPRAGVRSGFVKGLLVCLAAGILSPMVNFAFVFGAPLQQQALAAGTDPVYTSNAVWSIALTAGCLVNAGYCIYLLRSRKTGALYRGSRRVNWAWAALAGVLWYSSMMLYGMGGSFLGDAGVSVGWALMQSLAILTGNLAGLFTGEWRGAAPVSRRIMWLGLACLLAGVFIVAFSR